MLMKYVVFLALFSIIPPIKSVEYCLNFIKRKCHPCTPMDHDEVICERMSEGMKIIYFDNNNQIDYNSYVNSSIQIVENNNVSTFYSCQNRSDYLQVNPYNYYPIGKQLNLSLPRFKRSKPKVARSIKSDFQVCLEVYCFNKNNNRFVCYEYYSRNLDFAYNSIVTRECILNITYAFIWSRKIAHITKNMFFLNAVNIQFMSLDFEDMKSMQCNVFQQLEHLKILQFKVSFKTKFHIDNCIFQFNPKLVRVDINDNWIWNECKVIDNGGNQVVYVVSFVLLGIVSLCLMGASYYYYRRLQLLRNDDDNSDIKMCRIYSVTSVKPASIN